jgi:hypothetical protein
MIKNLIADPEKKLFLTLKRVDFIFLPIQGKSFEIKL